MMRFTLGVALLVFTLIIGGYSYFENRGLIDIPEDELELIDE